MELPVLETSPDTGLTAEQVLERETAGLANTPPKPLTKSTARIWRDNVLTPFNALFCFLGACLAAVGAYLDMAFLLIIVLNTLIGVFQEIRVKKALEKVSVLTQATATVLRDGRPRPLAFEELVRDDIILLKAGDQIPADGVVCEGVPEINEALLTGEADPVQKAPGDMLLSGSFVSAGHCRARLTRVGAQAYAARLAGEAKRDKKLRSEMMRSLDRLVRTIGFALAPLGIAMFVKQAFALHTGMKYAVTSTVAAVIGMVPEGLYLLTSVALAVGVLTLARKRALARELSCIENLAHVDVLCLDKTGTLTEGRLQVESLLDAQGSETSQSAFLPLAASFLDACPDGNATSQALAGYTAGIPFSSWRGGASIPFSSSRKYSACCSPEGVWYVLGAPEYLCSVLPHPVRDRIEHGLRALAFGRCLSAPDAHEALVPSQVQVLGYFILSDTLRADASDTLRFFARQGVEIKVISGDNAQSVADIARRAGVANADAWVDASTLQGEEALCRAASRYTVFGRMTPGQKRILIHALQQQGRTVAMTGDGVNDVLALKDADCSIAMASGSEAARQVSQLVLLDSDFSVLPHIFNEGRRVINNIQRTAALFLFKNIFSFLISFALLFIAMPYPFVPLQISLLSFFFIGAPGFLLTFEPCHEKVRGSFLRNILLAAAPGGLTCTVCILAAMAFSSALGLSTAQLSTLCTLVVGFAGILVLADICQPATLLRRAVLVVMSLGFSLAVLLFGPLFGLASLTSEALTLLTGLAALAAVSFWGLCRLCTVQRRRWKLA